MVFSSVFCFTVSIYSLGYWDNGAFENWLENHHSKPWHFLL